MKKFIFIKLVIVVFITYTSLADNHVPEAKIKGKDHESEDVKGMGTALSTRADASIAKAAEYLNSVKIDLTAAKEFLKGKVPNVWGADEIKEKIDQVISDAEQKLTEQKNKAAVKYAEELRKELAAKLKELDPNALFQGKYEYFKSKPDENKWSAIACNPGGAAGLTISAKGGMQFSAGVAVGFSANAEFAITLGGSVGINLTSFNPVDPTSGDGRTIMVTATPLYDSPWSFTVNTKALLEVEVSILVTFKGELDDVSTTLEIK